MRLEKYRCKQSGRVLIKPVEPAPKKNMALFKHCSEGMIAVTEDYFEENTRPLLFCHGVVSVEISDIKENSQ